MRQYAGQLEPPGLNPPDPRWSFVGGSAAMTELRAQAEAVAAVKSAVLITGESGTGKEVLARYIHACGPRAQMPFEPVSCAGLPEGLIESTLFGHDRGAFTGAVRQHLGVFERSSNGTLFLDDITELSIALQSKLLRALQSREFVRVGGEQILHSDARILCSTNLDPHRAMREGKLREDVYYRISGITLHIPPLRDRREDVPELARHLLRRKSQETGKRVARISPGAEALLLAHDWPGNVRELENLIERALVFCRGDEIGPELMSPISPGASYLALPWDAARDAALRRFELGYLSTLLRVYRGSVSECSKAMKISRQALYNLLDRAGLDPTSFRWRGGAPPKRHP